MRSLKVPSSSSRRVIGSKAKVEVDEDNLVMGPPISHNDLLRECVLKQIPLRRCKPFREIYDDVLNDYGAVASRTIHRALDRLLEERVIAHVISPYFGVSVSGYVLYTSPLLWDRDGFSHLVDMLEDAAGR